jgi:DNA-binding Lrp family transcriptional regulator
MKKKPPIDLDALDRKILGHHQGDTRLGAERIGAMVGLSTAAVHRRLKRMRDGGVIEAEVAVISPDAVGLPVTCIVAVDIDRESLGDLERFNARMRACPQVQQCFYVTGQADFMLVVVAPDMAAYEAFTREVLLSDSNVRSFTSHVVLARVKTGLGLPIAEPTIDGPVDDR